MMGSWNLLEGTQLDGRYLLERVLDSAEGESRFLARMADTERTPCVVEIVAADAGASRERRSRWESARPLLHPNLVRVIETSVAEVSGVPVFYAATEYADEVLADVLRKRVLNPDEARVVLRAAAGVLGYLHSKGLRYGELTPEDVRAAGDTIKLSISGIEPPSGGLEEAKAADFRSLGIMLFQCLTGRRDPSPASLALLPPDLAGVIRDYAVPPSGEEPQAAAPAPSADAAAPVNPASRRFPKWVFAAGPAAVALGAILIFHHPSHSSNPESRLPSSMEVPPVQAAPKVEEPPRAAAPAAARAPERSAERKYWRVVVYTYREQAAARRMADRLGQRWPQWKPEAVSPSRGVWLVAIGGRMNRLEAESLRREARANGLPRDTFARNYSF